MVGRYPRLFRAASAKVKGKEKENRSAEDNQALQSLQNWVLSPFIPTFEDAAYTGQDGRGHDAGVPTLHGYFVPETVGSEKEIETEAFVCELGAVNNKPVAFVDRVNGVEEGENQNEEAKVEVEEPRRQQPGVKLDYAFVNSIRCPAFNARDVQIYPDPGPSLKHRTPAPAPAAEKPNAKSSPQPPPAPPGTKHSASSNLL